MPRDVTFRGFKEIERGLARLPRTTATELQGTLVRHFIETRKVMAKTSTMSPAGKRAIRARTGIVRIEPDKRVSPRRLRDVHAAIYSTWRGGRIPKAEAAARTIESTTGSKIYVKRRKRGLLIPAGALLTPTGKVKRKNKKPINPADLPGTRFVRTKRGVLLVREKSTKTGKRARTEIVAVLVQKARATARLTFFRSWESLQPKHTRQFGAMLDRIIRRF